jgi:hypothetical protein
MIQTHSSAKNPAAPLSRTSRIRLRVMPCRCLMLRMVTLLIRMSRLTSLPVSEKAVGADVFMLRADRVVVFSWKGEYCNQVFNLFLLFFVEALAVLIANSSVEGAKITAWRNVAGYFLCKDDV